MSLFCPITVITYVYCCRKTRCSYFSCSPLCAAVSVLVAIILLSGLAALLVVLLHSSQQQQTTSTSKSKTFHILNQHYTIYYSGISNLKYAICQWDIQIKHIFCIANFTTNNTTTSTLSTSSTFFVNQLPLPTYPSHDEECTADESIPEFLCHSIFLLLKSRTYLYSLSYVYAIFL